MRFTQGFEWRGAVLGPAGLTLVPVLAGARVLSQGASCHQTANGRVMIEEQTGPRIGPEKSSREFSNAPLLKNRRASPGKSRAYLGPPLYL